MPLLYWFLSPFSCKQAIWVAVLAVCRKCSGACSELTKSLACFPALKHCGVQGLFRLVCSVPVGVMFCLSFILCQICYQLQQPCRCVWYYFCPNANSGIKINFLLSRNTRLAFSRFQHATCVMSLEALPHWWDWIAIHPGCLLRWWPVYSCM